MRDYENKFSILLGLTSNIGAEDLQLKTTDNDYIFSEMINSSKSWGDSSNMMYVVGATKADYIKKIRNIIPNHFLLIPGVGAQGGNLDEICKFALNASVGIIINSSRSIIYASNDNLFADSAAREAIKLQSQMKEILSSRN